MEEIIDRSFDSSSLQKHCLIWVTIKLHFIPNKFLKNIIIQLVRYYLIT